MGKIDIFLLSSIALVTCASPLRGQGASDGASPSPPREEARLPLLSKPEKPAASIAPPTNSVSAPVGYVLSPNDQVAVEVFGEDDLRTNGRVNSEGNLSLPLLGAVKLSGLSLTQAAAKLTDLYGRDYLVNPKVNVSLLGYAKRRFTLLGQVNRPGSYEMPDNSPEGVDLLEAIAMAGGYTRIAAPERISIKRGNQVMRVDAKRLTKREGGNFVVRPGDTVTVGESLF